MENASKALIMAGSMLIGIIILSIAVYLFASVGGSGKDIQKQVDARVMAEFNNNFLKYEGSKTCTIHDIVNLTKFAQKTNEALGYDKTDSMKSFYIQVVLNGRDLTQYTEQDLIALLNNMVIETDPTTGEKHLPYYECIEVKFENPEQINRVSKIVFKKS